MHGITEFAVDQLLEAELIVREEIKWRLREPSDRRIRCRLTVANRLGEHVELHMHIARRMPWQYTIVLVWRRAPIRRLDVRGSHRNVCDGSDETWTRSTHKHVWRDAFRDAWAYSPRDIPPTPALTLQQDEHPRVFEAFCAECQIQLDTVWVPPLDLPNQDTIGGGSS